MDLLSSVLRRPVAEDDKYSRGVVGFVTGSTDFPGAAILGVTAAIRTGVGMVRWVGPEYVGHMLLEVRPEVVLQPGRTQVWVVGSGVSGALGSEQASNISAALAEPGFAVIDAGALELVDYSRLAVNAVLTPHAGEAERLLNRLGYKITRAEVEENPISAAKEISRLTGQTVLLKGNVTTIADKLGHVRQTPPANPALATAGSGDVLAGILGALIASNNEKLVSGLFTLADIAYAAAVLHAEAGALAAMDGPVAALDIAEAMRTVVGDRLA